MIRTAQWRWTRKFIFIFAVTRCLHATTSFAGDDAIYFSCQGIYSLTTAGSPETSQSRASQLIHVYKITSKSLFDLDSNIPGMMRWGYDRCASHAPKSISCALTPDSFTLSDDPKNELGQAIIYTKLTIDRIHNTFLEVTQFPLKNAQQIGSGTCVLIQNPLPSVP